MKRAREFTWLPRRRGDAWLQRNDYELVPGGGIVSMNRPPWIVSTRVIWLGRVVRPRIVESWDDPPLWVLRHGVPPGLTLDEQTGTISGRPTAPGRWLTPMDTIIDVAELEEPEAM